VKSIQTLHTDNFYARLLLFFIKKLIDWKNKGNVFYKTKNYNGAIDAYMNNHRITAVG
jgi:hypothetical protein